MSLYDDMLAEYGTPAEALEAMRAVLSAEHITLVNDREDMHAAIAEAYSHLTRESDLGPNVTKVAVEAAREVLATQLVGRIAASAESAPHGRGLFGRPRSGPAGGDYGDGYDG